MTQAIAETGIPRSTLRRRLANAVASGAAPQSLAKRYALDSFGKQPTPTPSVEKARLAAAERRATDAERRLAELDTMRLLSGGIASTPSKPPRWLTTSKAKANGSRSQSTPILHLTDWHLGERVNPAEAGGYRYDLAVAESRIRRTVETATELCRDHLAGLDYPGIVIALGGDMISGALHPELAESDELGIIPSCIRARDLIIGVIDAMKREFGRVFVPTAVGNHGRSWDRKPRAKGYAQRNIDHLIYHLVADHYASDTDVHVVVPDAGETVFSVHGVAFLLTHGDMLGAKGGDGVIGALGPISRGTLKTRRSMESLGKAVDHLLIGHWHQSLFLRDTTVSGSLKGPDEYALKHLRAPTEDPSQTLLVVHPKHGITFRQPIFLTDEHCPGNEASRSQGGWVSVFSEAA